MVVSISPFLALLSESCLTLEVSLFIELSSESILTLEVSLFSGMVGLGFSESLRTIFGWLTFGFSTCAWTKEVQDSIAKKSARVNR